MTPSTSPSMSAGTKFYMPSKIASYLKRLLQEYRTQKYDLYVEIINSARVLVVQDVERESWNGDSYGHDVKFFLPLETIAKFNVQADGEMADKLRADLNACSRSVRNEYVSGVFFEVADQEDPEFQRAIAVIDVPQINADELPFWKKGHIRLFISHRDKDKQWAHFLANELEAFGISAFVAHDTISPGTAWEQEIIRGLETMEVMLAFITDDFDSPWTNQEIGFALGRQIPIIPLKLENKNPSGLIASIQALRACLERPVDAAPAIYKMLRDKLDKADRLQGSLIAAFCEAPNFDETRYRFDRMEKGVDALSGKELILIRKAFEENDQIYNAYYLGYSDRLRKFLKKTTGKDFRLDQKKLTLISNGDIPF